jgi:chemotaxis protein CheC
MGEFLLALRKLGRLNDMGEKVSEMVAASLSGMVGIDVSMDVAAANIVTVEEVIGVIGFGPDDVVAGVYVSFDGEIGGSTLCIYTSDAAMEFAEILLAGIEDNPPEEGQILSDVQESALLELSNVITSGFIDTWANELELALTQYPPVIVYDYLPTIMQQIMMEIAETSEYTIAFDTRRMLTDMNFGLDIIVLPDINAIEMLL